MSKFILSITLIFAASIYLNAQRMPPPEKHKVQVAILFDTSNSMDGLIDQAKSRIWSIVNEIGDLRYNGEVPSIEIALYHYGNDGLSSRENYVQQIVPLTNDLDLISQKLFGLTTNGGSEFCGAVMDKSIMDLKWSESQTDLKMIYIAGNEPFNQGPISYKVVCKKAAAKGIFINTIYCGDYDQGIREFWLDGSRCTQGDYFNIDSDKEVVHIDTPYDDDIRIYNDSINGTYYGYGKLGRQKKSMQLEEDMNASATSLNVATERTISKSKGAVYSNSTWDIVDAVDKDGIDVTKMDDKELPKEIQGKSDAEKKKFVEEKSEDRKRYQKKVADLAKKRQSFIDAERKKRAAEGVVDDFGSSINKSIMKKAEKAGFKKEAQN